MTRSVFCGIALTAAACGGGAPSRPSALPTFPDSNPKLSVTVMERLPDGGTRPMPGVDLTAFLLNNTELVGRQIAEQSTDAQGRASVTGAPVIWIAFAARRAGFVQPCAAVIQTDEMGYAPDITVELVATATVVGDQLPARFTPPVTLSGTIVDRLGTTIPSGRVDLHTLDGFVLSNTVSDTAGRYLLCDLPTWSGQRDVAAVSVTKEGYDGISASLTIGQDAVHDFELF